MSASEILFVVAQLIFLEGILSIDNAAVLGAMVSVLPANEPIPWPRSLAFMHGWGDRVLGGQRAAALKVGLLGAYVGRGLMLLLATWVIRNPWLRILGAAYLLKLAVSHLGGDQHAGEEDGADRKGSFSETAFWRVVVAVELADLAFSLDNVVAAVALSDRFWVVMLGVALGILTMRFAAQLFTVMIEREPVLVTAAYILVFNISLELLIADISPYLWSHEIDFVAWQKFLISVLTLVLCVIYAHTPWLRQLLRPALRLIARFFGLLDAIFDYLLLPLKWLWQGLMLIARALFAWAAPKHAGDAGS
ncbi:MAG: hypothetical protein K1X65_13205 [Caldilineales bacterium]|nr:hypothetical protein [Caldilineales bacterium]MCW5858929.1 hypothetical protein [Caldilineales bacterium]